MLFRFFLWFSMITFFWAPYNSRCIQPADVRNILLFPTAISLSRMHREHEFIINISPFHNTDADTSVELTLQGESGGPRTFTATSTDGTIFHVNAIPYPVSNTVPLLQMIVTSGVDQIYCHIRDCKILVNDEPMMLSDVRTIENAHKTRVTRTDGTVTSGSVPALAAMEVLLGRVPSTLDLSQADRIVLSADLSQTLVLDYRIVVKQGSRVVGDQIGSLAVVAGSPPSDLVTARRLVTEARTVDSVLPGDGQSESDHKLAGLDIASAEHLGRKWRAATHGSWFAYTVKVPTTPSELICTYWGSESGDRTFDILVDGEKIATQTLANNRLEEFYEEVYPIPVEATRGKNQITVRFQAHPGNMAGGLFGLRIMKRPRLRRNLL